MGRPAVDRAESLSGRGCLAEVVLQRLPTEFGPTSCPEQIRASRFSISGQSADTASTGKQSPRSVIRVALSSLRQDRRQLKRINQLIQACLRDAFVGIGKPEPLRENLSGCWSRRIDDEHRLIVRLEGTTLVILACRYHDR